MVWEGTEEVPNHLWGGQRKRSSYQGDFSEKMYLKSESVLAGEGWNISNHGNQAACVKAVRQSRAWPFREL